MYKNKSSELLITIVTVVYNSRDQFEETITSVLNQLYNNIEYIVIDGGSNDGTVNVINRNKDRIHYWISEPDEGIFYAMNKALKSATGDFIIFMNAGDIFYSPSTISDLVKRMADKNSVYYGNAIFVSKLDNTTIKRGGFFSKYRLSKTNICHQSILYPKSIYKRHSYDLKYKTYADWEYNMRMFSLSKLIYIDQNIVFYDTSGITAFNQDDVFAKDRIALVYKYLGVNCILCLIYNKLWKTLSNSINKLITLNS